METSNPAITPEDILTHAAWLNRLARRLISPSPEAEDAVQDTWAAAVKNPPDRARPLRPWLAEVLRNFVRMGHRSDRRRRQREQDAAPLADTTEALPTAEDLLARQEAQRILAESLAGLEEPYRTTVWLCYAEGLAPSEVARKQELPAGTVRWRLKRGLDDLRARVETRYAQSGRDWRAALAPLGAQGAALAVGVAGRGGLTLLTKFSLAAGLVAACVLALLAGRAHRGSQATEPVAGLTTRVGPTSAPDPVTAARPAGPTPDPTPPPEPSLAAAAPAPREARAEPPPGRPREESMPAAVAAAAAPGKAPTRGNSNAPVTVVIFADFQCPFSAKSTKTLSELEAAFPHDVRFAFKQLPLPFHKNAALAAEAALAAHEQGKFWEMHDRLFAHQDDLDRRSLEAHAQALKLDVAKFTSALDTHRFRADVEADAAQAKKAKITGTPSFLVNGHAVVGAQPLDAFKKAVEQELARARGLAAPPRQWRVAAPSVVPYEWPPPRLALADDKLGWPVNMPLVRGDAPVRGAARTDVEVFVFFPYEQAGAALWKRVIDGIFASYGADVRFVMRPVASPESPSETLNAEAAWAAHEQLHFWSMHEKLSANPPDDRATLEKYAEEIGLDVDEFRDALDEHRYQTRVADDTKLAARGGFHQGEEPVIVAGGRQVSGPVALVQLIEQALAKAGRPVRVPVGKPVDFQSADYSPQELGRQLRWHDVFSIEPRDPAWAGDIEKLLGPLADTEVRRLVPGATQVKVECHSQLCRVTWSPSPAGCDITMLSTGPRRRYLSLGPGRLTIWVRNDSSYEAQISEVRDWFAKAFQQATTRGNCPTILRF